MRGFTGLNGVSIIGAAVVAARASIGAAVAPNTALLKKSRREPSRIFICPFAP
jgi:hypothetical protein